MTPTLWVCAVLTAVLAAYALGHYLGSLVFLFARPRPRVFDARPQDSVSVLIPARNEGQQAVRVIESLLAQDHSGPVDVLLLLKDRRDTCLPHLKARFPEATFDGTEEIVELSASEGRRAAVAFTGHDPKHDKVNWMASRATTDTLAILDCDHQAHPDWLRTSLCLMHEQDAKVVQGRRGPIAARGLFQLWDSLHQHIGCELFQVAFTRLGLTVFFTGTTVVMDTSLLQAHPLQECITEDTDFSYRIVLDGHRIIANPWSGSDEEVSPDLYSFLARRRRWANGHTDAFLRHLRRLPSAPIRLRDKLQFLFHGTHYLLAIPVFVLHLLIGLLLVGRLPPTTLAAAVGSSLLLGGLLLRSQRTIGWGRWLSEVVVVFGWIFPAAVIVMNIATAALLGGVARMALPLPYTLQALGLAGLVAPLFVLLVGLAGFRQLSIGTFVTVVVTWPVAFYLDLCGVLIGMVDCLFGRRLWHAVARPEPAPTDVDSAQPTYPAALHIKESWRLFPVLAATRASASEAIPLMMKPSRWLPWAALAALFLGGVLYTPSTRIRVADANCEVMEHDKDPWILHPDKIEGYCGTSDRPRYATRTGSFKVERDDALTSLDPSFWDVLDTTFFCNDALFQPKNVVMKKGGGAVLWLQPEESAERKFTSGNIATKDVPDAQFLYGRFETVMKPAKAAGVLTAFFLYRFDPWQEIDMEFLGRDTSKILLNVYYNPGEEGDLYNYGYRGTPVLIDLGFDAADDFHRYAIEWDAEEIRWFVDDTLIHRRVSGRPTPIPHLPMRFHANMWPTCSEELAGPLDQDALPVAAEFQSFTFSSWTPATTTGVSEKISSLFGDEEPADWRDEAEWVQPGR